MIIFKSSVKLTAFIETKKKQGNVIGFVPTMGALHSGHISLIKASRLDNSITVSSIFVNPTQFNNKDDFAKYPVTIESDIDKLEGAGCEVLFLPSVEEMYPPDEKLLTYQLGDLEKILEGAFRTGHYQGVCQIVHKLLDIVQPHILYLGQKDYQQCMVIKKLVSLMNIRVEIKIEKTIREVDGLAMSSRNVRLNDSERKRATKIFEALSEIKKKLPKGDPRFLKKQATEFLEANGFKVDYVEIANADNLQVVDNLDGSANIVILIAAYLNEVRLIDNFVVEVD